MSSVVSAASTSSRPLTPFSVASSRPQTPLQSTIPRSKVLVVGSGLAALAASTELVARGIPVHILERQAKPGGNSIKASSGINGTPTRFQHDNSGDSVQNFYNDTVKSVGEELLTSSFSTQREEVIRTLTTGSAEAINWLVEEQGIDLSRVAQLGGHSIARTHRGAGQTPPGASIILTLLKKLKENNLVTIDTGCNVSSVIRRGKDGMVVGVEIERQPSTSTDSQAEGASKTKETLTGPVIFAAGGFAGDSQGLLKRYRPDLAGLPSTNEALPGSARLLRQIGAQLRDMELVQVHPTGFVDETHGGSERFRATKFLAAEVLRGEGGILVSRGRRFVNELQTRKVVADTIMALEPCHTTPLKQWNVQLVLDEATYEAAKSHVDFYLWKGLMRKTTVGEMENSETLLSTLEEYAASIPSTSTKHPKPDPLGRHAFGHWRLTHPTPSTPLYIGTVTPVVHYTMGGVAFSAQAQVLDDSNRPIPGLWAAGEITGGLHGGNRLGGSSLLECVVFGRVAGQQVAEALRKHEWTAEYIGDDKGSSHYESPA